MKVTKYEIVKYSTSIKYKDRDEIKTGCTNYRYVEWPVTMESYEKKEDAMKELGKYSSSATFCPGQYRGAGFYEVTEYCVEENVYDDITGEFYECPNVWAYTQMPEMG